MEEYYSGSVGVGGIFEYNIGGVGTPLAQIF